MSEKRGNAAHVAAFVLYAALAVVLTLPLVLNLGDHLLGTDSNALNDSYFSVWIFGWQARQLIADPLNLFQGNIFYPFPNTLAFSEIILPGALAYLPLEYATGNPVLAYNLVVMLSFPLNGFAMYLYALDWMRGGGKGDITSPLRGGDAARWSGWAGAFVAGLVFAFCTYKFGELRHVQLLLAMFMPLTLMYVTRFLRTPNLHTGLLVGLFFALNALASLYYAVFLAFAVLLLVGLDAWQRRLRYRREHFLYGALAIGLALVLVVPFLLPFLRLEREYDFSAGRDPRLFSARPASFLATPASQWLYGGLTRSFYVASKGQPLFPGIAALALAGVGVFALVRGKSRAWVFPVLLGLMGVVLSFGPVLVTGRGIEAALPFPLPYAALMRVVSPLASLNAPSRFVVLTMLALALLAAVGTQWLMTRSTKWGVAIGVLVALVVLAEYVPAPLRLTPVAAGANISPVYLFLREQPAGQAVVELPMGKPTFADQDKYVEYTYNAIYHLQPLVNGYSTFLPPDYYALVNDAQEFPAGRAVRRLKRWGAEWLVVHSDRYEDTDKLRKHLDKNKLIEHVADYGEIWLYRVRER